LLEKRGELILAQLKRQNGLKLKVQNILAKVYPQEEKQALMTEAQQSKSPNIYPALMLAQNTGMRSSEIRRLQWTHIDLKKRFLIVGRTKTDAGEGRTVPLNSSLFEALSRHAVWFEARFGKTETDLYLFPFGKAKNLDLTLPVTTLKTAWRYVKKSANVKGRLHDSRHTLNHQTCRGRRRR
jgi:integrase